MSLTAATSLPGELASRWQRLGAHILDSAVSWIIILIPVQMIWQSSTSAELNRLVLYAPSFYWIICNIYGVSIGKRWLRIVIRRSDGQAPGVRFGLLRSIDILVVLGLALVTENQALLLSTFILFELGHAILLWTRNKQTLFDKLAGTYVVRMRSPDTAADFTL